MPLVRGRAFTAADGRPGSEAAIVNERFVQMFLSEQEPIGARIRVGSEETPWLQIVGVATTVRQQQMPARSPIRSCSCRSARRPWHDRHHRAHGAGSRRGRVAASKRGRGYRSESAAVSGDEPRAGREKRALEWHAQRRDHQEHRRGGALARAHRALRRHRLTPSHGGGGSSVCASRSAPEAVRSRGWCCGGSWRN